MRYFVINKANCKVKVCNGKDELISFFASYNYKNGKGKHNLLLENIAMNNNDKKLKYDFFTSKNIHVPREYMVYDELGKIIDPRFYEEDILNYNENKLKNQNESITLKTRVCNLKVEIKPLAHFGNKFRHYFRCAKTMNEKRQNAILENKNFVRGRRKVSHISPTFDDYYVDTEKNWKRFKIEKQYMKNYFLYKPS